MRETDDGRCTLSAWSDELNPGNTLVDERPGMAAGSRTACVVSVGADTVVLRWEDSERDVLWPLPLPVGIRKAWPWET